ncbi:cobalt ABC transporter ATP-binding subunit [Spiroplasma clarkii]|uniref:Cobalt ABC transporter ATP-binding subunit n=1 Tax=Spiroplasma clarkii TaxID=2139 RepID=A0A1Y0L008_9MOLU|nr:energy-coupling factor transporter ATPase [Spiroplasma clarkii]ARU91110.1 cobalt ABC transporter ATP-binding subunit [Spiroplasma clarkii]ATX70554.1 cobalt ABC transporter ATP-binding subunit [Spiroplasma clarkii]
MAKFLTASDLNEFKLLINEYRDKLNRSGQKLVVAKAKYSKKEVELEFVQRYETEYRENKAKYKANAHTKKFVDNINLVKTKISKAKANNSDLTELLTELQTAKQLLKDARFSLRDKGNSAELSKINKVALKLEDIKFRYKDDFPFAVDGVSVEVKHGEYVAIIGHNGSGKSTLSKIIIGVLKPTSGAIAVYGNRVTSSNLSVIRKFMGIVFQNPDNQFIGSTVKDDIAFGLENRRVEPADMEEIIQKAAKKVNMHEFLDHEPLMLSGGQKQRVAIASALALSPDIMIFDEATSMLDPKGKTEVKNIMVELKNTREKTIFSITHDMDEILNADKVMVMNAGQLVKFGTPSEILSDKNFLRSIHLDIPFVAQVEEALEEVGLKLEHSESLEELVERICQK